MGNLWLVKIEVDAPREEPGFSNLIKTLREFYPPSGTNLRGLGVSYTNRTAIATHSRVIDRHACAREVRNAEYVILSKVLAETCPRARGTVTVCALASVGPTYRVEFYSFKQEAEGL